MPEEKMQRWLYKIGRMFEKFMDVLQKSMETRQKIRYIYTVYCVPLGLDEKDQIFSGGGVRRKKDLSKRDFRSWGPGEN